MRLGSSDDQVRVEHRNTPLSDLAREALRNSRAMLLHGELGNAAVPLVRALDSGFIVELQVRAALTVPLARILAAQGHLAEAVTRLSPVLDAIDDRRVVAHIYCARAVELAGQSEFLHALSHASRAEELAPSDPEVRTVVDRVCAVVVPACVLTEHGSTEISDGLIARALRALIERFKSAPNNMQLAHVIALLAEHCATRADIGSLQAAVHTVEHGRSHPHQTAFPSQEHSDIDGWPWAIRCWVLLAHSDGYWQRWHRHLEEIRGESASTEVDIRVVGEHALKRMRTYHERLREIYRQPGSSLYDAARSEKHLRYLVEVEIERRGAQALADVIHQAPDLARSCGFVGPIAGIPLLAAIGRSAAVLQLQKALQGEQSLAEPEQQLRECLSPFAPIYAMDGMGLIAEAEAYCRRLSDGSTEVRAHLCAILFRRAHAALTGGDSAEARSACLEALRLDPSLHFTGWTPRAIGQLVVAPLDSLSSVTATTFEESEAIIMSAERTFPGDPNIVRLRLIQLRSRVDWHLLNEPKVATLRGRIEPIKSLAEDVERAWALDTIRDEEDQRWTAVRLAQLAEICAPDKGWPITLAPYDTGLALVDRALRLVPGHSALTFQKAETLRLKGNAIVYLEGGFYNKSLSDQVRRTVLDLFTQSWTLDDTMSARALDMAEICDIIGETASAEWYAYAGLALEPANAKIRDLLAKLHARPVYEAATRDVESAEQLIDQGRYSEAVSHLRRADQALTREEYDSAWDDFVELHRVVRHNLEVLQQSGFW